MRRPDFKSMKRRQDKVNRGKQVQAEKRPAFDRARARRELMSDLALLTNFYNSELLPVMNTANKFGTTSEFLLPSDLRQRASNWSEEQDQKSSLRSFYKYIWILERSLLNLHSCTFRFLMNSSLKRKSCRLAPNKIKPNLILDSIETRQASQ